MTDSVALSVMDFSWKEGWKDFKEGSFEAKKYRNEDGSRLLHSTVYVVYYEPIHNFNTMFEFLLLIYGTKASTTTFTL